MCQPRRKSRGDESVANGNIVIMWHYFIEAIIIYYCLTLYATKFICINNPMGSSGGKNRGWQSRRHHFLHFTSSLLIWWEEIGLDRNKACMLQHKGRCRVNSRLHNNKELNGCWFMSRGETPIMGDERRWFALPSDSVWTRPTPRLILQPPCEQCDPGPVIINTGGQQ